MGKTRPFSNEIILAKISNRTIFFLKVALNCSREDSSRTILTYGGCPREDVQVGQFYFENFLTEQIRINVKSKIFKTNFVAIPGKKIGVGNFEKNSLF